MNPKQSQIQLLLANKSYQHKFIQYAWKPQDGDFVEYKSELFEVVDFDFDEDEVTLLNEKEKIVKQVKDVYWIPTATQCIEILERLGWVGGTSATAGFARKKLAPKNQMHWGPVGVSDDHTAILLLLGIVDKYNGLDAETTDRMVAITRFRLEKLFEEKEPTKKIILEH